MPPKKLTFYYGHRKPSQNRPVVHGGHFTHRPNPHPHPHPHPHPLPKPIDFRHWDPQNPTQTPPKPPPPSHSKLSPIARYILDSLLRHRGRWSPAVTSDLSKLRHIPPDVISEILRLSPPHPLLPPPLLTRLFHFAISRQNKKSTLPFSLFNSLSYSLYRSNLHRAADHVPTLMLSLGKPPSEKQLEILVRFHSQTRRGLRLYHVYSKFRAEFSIRPRLFLYNRILDGLIKSNHIDLAMLVYQDLLADGLKEEAITFTILMKGLCKEGRVDEAIGLLEKMRREVCKPDVFAYTAMVKVLAEEGRDMDGCLRVWEEMKRDRVEGDAMAYATMVSGLCEVGRVEKGLELFREMKRKGFLIDRSVYGDLVRGFVKRGEVEEGCRVLKEMVGDGYRPDLGIYDCLIGGLCEDRNEVEKAYKIFQVVISEGLTPSFETVTPLMVALADSDDMDRFFGLISRIGDLGLPVMDHLANFFKTFVVEKKERELKAMEVFEALKGKGYCSVAVYNILVEALHKCTKGRRALVLFEEMKSSEDLEPDSCTYSLIIPCYVDVGDVIEACSCYNKMKEMSWTPRIEAYYSLVKGLCKIGEIDPAITLVKDCLGNVTNGPMEFKYTLTILNVCRSRKPEKVLEVLDEMMGEGYPLEDIIYCAVIHGFCKHARSEEARKVLRVMKDRNHLSEASYILYEEILNEHLKKITSSLVLSGLKFFGLESKLKLLNSSD